MAFLSLDLTKFCVEFSLYLFRFFFTFCSNFLSFKLFPVFLPRNRYLIFLRNHNKRPPPSAHVPPNPTYPPSPTLTTRTPHTYPNIPPYTPPNSHPAHPPRDESPDPPLPPPSNPPHHPHSPPSSRRTPTSPPSPRVRPPPPTKNQKS